MLCQLERQYVAAVGEELDTADEKLGKPLRQSIEQLEPQPLDIRERQRVELQQRYEQERLPEVVQPRPQHVPHKVFHVWQYQGHYGEVVFEQALKVPRHRRAVAFEQVRPPHPLKVETQFVGRVHPPYLWAALGRKGL